MVAEALAATATDRPGRRGDVLDLLMDLNRPRGGTIAMAPHDLDLAAWYAADHLVVVADGAIVTCGPPGGVPTPETARTAFGLEARAVPDPICGAPRVVPVGRFHGGPPGTD